MHRTPLSARLAWLLALALTACLAPASARAQVHDNAHLFSTQAVSDADAAIAQMQQRHNRGLVVETFPAVPDDQRAAVQQDKAAFFKRWTNERGKALGVNGVYVMICMDPRFVDLRPGRETQERGDFTTSDIRSVSDKLKADLRGDRNDAALADTVDGVERAYTANITGASPEPRASGGGGMTGSGTMPPVYPRSTPSVPSAVGGLGIGSLVCIGVGLLIVFSLVRSIFGHRNTTGGGFGGGGFGGGGTGFGGGGVTNYPTGGPAYGPGPGYPSPPARGGGFGSGLLGGLLGGAVGGYAADRFDHRNDPSSNAGFGGGGDPGAGSFGGGGSPGFDSGPSDAGSLSDDSGGGDFGGGGGDSGGGGGDSGGGGDPGAGSF